MTIFRSLARPPRNPSGITEWQQRQIREFAFCFRKPLTDEEREEMQRAVVDGEEVDGVCLSLVA